jgi:spore coat protein U-like protein
MPALLPHKTPAYQRLLVNRPMVGKALLRRFPAFRAAMPLAAAFLAACFAMNPSAQAATAPSNIAVSATVMATCTNTVTPMAFGFYAGVQLDSTATITVTCTNTTPYNVGLSSGMAPAATVTTRRMTGAVTVFLAYALFSDSGRTTNWGATIGTDTVAGVGSGTGQVLTVYGRVAAGQFPAPGPYTDTIIATVVY